MYHWFKNVLDKQQLQRINELYDKAEFADGKETATGGAKDIKENRQMTVSEEYREINSIIQKELNHHLSFKSAVMPLHMREVRLSQYSKGMYYGRHMDSPIMGSGDGRMRSDVSVTVFLSSPKDYAGGELMISTSLGEQAFKLNAGDIIAYPSTTLHRVAPVTHGERRVAIMWIQSLVKDPLQRETLHEMDKIRRKMITLAPDSDETSLANKVYTNLVRRWSEV